MNTRLSTLVLTFTVFLLSGGLVTDTLAAQLARGELREILVHGRSLEDNRLRVDADRRVAVYLPPSYANGSQRYPVVYLLHGILDSYRTWVDPWSTPPEHPGFSTIAELMDAGIARGSLREMIVVMPDAEKTCHYTDGPIKGGWTSFIAQDLVDYVDRTFRTVASPGGRGLLGHSMGGHGAIKIAMLVPDRFSAVYAMNPSMLGWGGDVSSENAALRAIDRISRLEDLANADFYVQAVVGIGQCFAPDPTAPLLTRAPVANSATERSWKDQMPVFMAPRHVAALRSLRGLRFDSAFEDEFTHIPITTREFSRVLDSIGVPHRFEMYNGDHRNRLWGPEGRLLSEALPFFSQLLSSGAEGVATFRMPTGASFSSAGGGWTAAPTTAPAPSAPAVEAAAASRATPEIQEALWAAARRGDIPAATRALDAGADVNALDSLSDEGGRSGRRALNFAALHNRAAMVRFLVSRGADVSRPNRTGFTPLHHAAESGAVPAAQALLALGANPNAKLPSGSTPLAVARQRRHDQMVRLLEPLTTP